MENIATKSTGDDLTAAEFNQIPDELENAITSMGIVLSGADTTQLAKAIAGYVARGDFYSDGGAADAYVLSALGVQKTPPAYANGMRVRFVPGNANTGASTVNVAGLGVKNILDKNGAAIAAGVISPLRELVLRYDGAAVRIESVNPAVAFQSGKNSLINGSFEIWERGVSFSAGAQYGPDRWYIYTLSNTTLARASRPIGENGANFLEITNSSGANISDFAQAFETFVADQLRGKTVTISFKAKCSVGTETLTVGLYKNATADSAAGGVWSAISSSGKTLTTTAQRFTLTTAIPGDASTVGLAVRFLTSNITNGTTINVWDVQIEEGSVATDFERRNIGHELLLCQRYFFKNTGNGQANVTYNSTTNLQRRINIFTPVTMRVVPTTSNIVSVNFTATPTVALAVKNCICLSGTSTSATAGTQVSSSDHDAEI